MFGIIQKLNFFHILNSIAALCFCIVAVLATEAPKCGQRNVGGVDSTCQPSRVGESEFGEFPWTIDITSPQGVYCSGSLIHPRVVLTAGQCVLRGDKQDLKIRAGLWDRQANNDRLPYQERTVKKTIVHPGMGIHRNDVALIILDEPFTLTSHIQTICLPPSNHAFANGTTCYATGWGRTSIMGGLSQKMKRITLTTVDTDTCEKETYWKMHNSVLCAVGHNGNDTCSGDSGAPLVCRVNSDSASELYHQIGITSFGAACFAGVPGGYTNVAYGRDWIDEHMTSNGLEK